MTRTECLDVLALFQALGVRSWEHQAHPPGAISAASPWWIEGRDHNDLRVDFHTKAEAIRWLDRYWIKRRVFHRLTPSKRKRV